MSWPRRCVADCDLLVSSSADALIAWPAIARDHILLATGRDFSRAARHLPLCI